MARNLPEHPFYDIDGPLAIAHRGGDAAGVEKENSLAAFQSALEAGIAYSETDTVATRDGVALAVHGSRNKKQQAQTGLPVRAELQNMTLDEVQRNIRVGGEAVPTLEEVLVTFPGMRFFIDPKTKESVRPLAKLINKLSVHDRVSIGAFNYDRTQAVADLVSEKARVCTTIGVIGSLALLGGKIKFPLAKEYLKHTSATQFAVPYNRVDASMVDMAHDLGLRTILWTPNSEPTIRSSFETGADGVMSDRTELIKAIADERRTTRP